MKFFAVTFNKTGEYGDMYEETRESILLANNCEDIVEYLKKTYMRDATQEMQGDIVILSRDVEDFPQYFIHEILVYEVNIKSLTEKVSYLG